MAFDDGSVGVRNVSRLPANTGAEGIRSWGVTAIRDNNAVLALAGGEASGTTITGPRGNTVGRGAAVGRTGGAVAGRGVEGADGGKGPVLGGEAGREHDDRGGGER